MEILRTLKSFAIVLPDRSKTAVNELLRGGVIPELFSATDMRSKPVPDTWREQPNNLGSSLSWLGLLEHASSSNEVFLVFEDDFYFRFDTLQYMPTLSQIGAIDFDCIYLTGHYAKGGTRVEPRRWEVGNGLVKAFGIHTLPARILTRRYAKILIDRINQDMRTIGRGADRADAVLSSERKKTYALEAHIGGQRSGDRRSWEPRVYDSRIKYAAAVISEFPDGSNPADLAETTALIALASRFSHIAVLNGSVRTLGAAAEAATENSGTALAYNSIDRRAEYEARPDDRLRRYVVYGSLAICSFDDIDTAAQCNCLIIQYDFKTEEALVSNHALSLINQVSDQGIVVIICAETSDTDRHSAFFRANLIKRNFRSSGRILFGNKVSDCSLLSRTEVHASGDNS